MVQRFVHGQHSAADQQEIRVLHNALFLPGVKFRLL
jgi:hypothetical protein